MNLKKNSSGIYVASFRTAEGRTKSVTTKSTELGEAKRIVKESGLADLELAARAGRLTREAIGHITTGKKLTMAKAVEAWEDWMASIGRSGKTIYNNAAVVKEWVKDSSVNGLPPSAINEKHISSFINNSTDAKASTRKVKLASIRSFFGYCAAKGWSVGDPSRLVRVNMGQLSHTQKEKSVREPFTNVEVARLLLSLKDDLFWRFAVAISNEIGLRLGDICQLEWDCFNIPDHVVVWTDKRDKRVQVPVSKVVLDMVAEVPVISAQYMFPKERIMTLDPAKRAGLSVQFKRICERNNIEGKSFHCLRHACITRWAKEGKSLESIGKDVGHSNTKTTEGYVHS